MTTRTDDTPKARKLSPRAQRNHQQVAVLLALGTFDAVAFQAVTGKTPHTYMSGSGWTTGEHKGQPAVWNPIFQAAVRMGVGCTFTKVGGKATVTMTQLDEAEAQAQREALERGIARYAEAKAARKAARERAAG